MTNSDMDDTRPTCPDCQSRMDCVGGDGDCTYYNCQHCGLDAENCSDYDDYDISLYDDDGNLGIDDHFGELDPSNYHGS